MSFTPGWNDPPTGFGYQSSTDSTTSTRSLLNRRVAFPTDPSSNAAPAPSANLPPHNLIQAPPAVGIFLPGGTAPVAPAAAVNPTAVLSDSSIVPEFTDEQILENLITAAKNAAVPADPDRNLMKRLDKLKDQLRDEKISTDCRQKLCQLVHCINVGSYDQAYSIQARLMVDHQQEVKDWLIGPKNIIMLCQKRSAAHS